MSDREEVNTCYRIGIWGMTFIAFPWAMFWFVVFPILAEIYDWW